MEKVNIKIGSVTFDRADYDADNDVLYLSIGEPNGGECEETPEMHVVCYAPGTYDIRALTIFNTRARIAQDGDLIVTLPETSRTSAEHLAPALAAVETPAEASRRR
jgi:hypothetical protein